VDSAGQLVSANVPLAAASSAAGATQATPVGGLLQQATANLTGGGAASGLGAVTAPVKTLLTGLLRH
jgi:hypothetical protein